MYLVLKNNNDNIDINIDLFDDEYLNTVSELPKIPKKKGILLSRN